MGGSPRPADPTPPQGRVGQDLTGQALTRVLGDRPVRCYPALLSTEAEAMSWARAGGPDGGVVTAGYQVAPRGRGGIPWDLPPGEGLAFSLLWRPALPPHREGWLYTLATCGLAAALGEDVAIEWPDELYRGDRKVGAVGIRCRLGPEQVQWGVLSLLARDARPPRADLLGRIVQEVEAHRREQPEEVVGEHQRRLATLGRRVRARLTPGGASAPTFTGEAVRTKADGALVVATDDGPKVGVPPQQLQELEDPGDDPGGRRGGEEADGHGPDGGQVAGRGVTDGDPDDGP